MTDRVVSGRIKRRTRRMKGIMTTTVTAASIASNILCLIGGVIAALLLDKMNQRAKG